MRYTSHSSGVKSSVFAGRLFSGGAYPVLPRPCGSGAAASSFTPPLPPPPTNPHRGSSTIASSALRTTLTALLRKLKQQSRESVEDKRPRLLKALKEVRLRGVSLPTPGGVRNVTLRRSHRAPSTNYHPRNVSAASSVSGTQARPPRTPAALRSASHRRDNICCPFASARPRLCGGGNRIKPAVLIR
ncbi:hypothetical protein JZ751_024774 [Albula glossodonta]|uniref:Uncharacterized protein n=1 Tax=Albula glossodonta TaxID=121402 RepID=A0A8T2PEC5_9TELE|nr:hypothetical protein JZ751_024774 [Albula glossodonta]